MWLVNTTTLKLVFHANEPKNEYMALSHTWEDEEVTFQDIQDQKLFARTKKGFSKIKGTCRLARAALLQWAWIDTCCIDKTSSVELSEAINSMFKWYQNAAVCSVYLTDLRPFRPGPEKASQEEHCNSDKNAWTKVDLPKCRWFTRGWTLQELLAPKRVNFYDREWNLRGDKFSLSEPISTITRIDPLALTKSRSLISYPVAVRMSWASTRQTTRPEDRAYCLFGIFDIHMPMLYGEGKRAFVRLQDEICKTTNDLSIFAWTNTQEYYDRPEGLFAPSPDEFRDCHNLARLSTSRRRKCDFTVTHDTVRFESALVYTYKGKPILMLDCYDLSRSDDNPVGVGIRIDMGWTQFYSKMTGSLYHGIHRHTDRPKVLALEFWKLAFSVWQSDIHPAVAQVAETLKFIIPAGVGIVSLAPSPSTTTFSCIKWTIDDPEYMAYCLLAVQPIKGRPISRPFQCLVAWGHSKIHGINSRAFVWTEECRLWPEIMEIIESDSESFPWPQSYALRELLLENRLFHIGNEVKEVSEACYTGKDSQMQIPTVVKLEVIEAIEVRIRIEQQHTDELY